MTQEQAGTSAALIVRPTDMPGLFDVEWPNGLVNRDLTQGQVNWIIMQRPDLELGL